MSAALSNQDDTITEGGEQDIEARARAMGWKPQSEYRGPPAAWRDAATFVAKGENDLPIVRERLRHQNQAVEDLKRQNEEIRETLRYTSDMVRKSEERGYNRALAEAKAEREAAVDAGDRAAFRAAEAKITDLEKDKPKPPPAATAPASVPPEVQEWVEANPWFREDRELGAQADALHTSLQRRMPGLSLKENLARVTAAIKAANPEKFPAPTRAADSDPEVEPDPDNPRRRGPPDVSSSSTPARRERPDAQTFNNLPEDSKAAFAKYSRQFKDTKPGWKPITKEEWAAAYFGEEGR